MSSLSVNRSPGISSPLLFCKVYPLLPPSVSLYPIAGRKVGDQFYLLNTVDVYYEHIRVEEDTANTWIGYDATHGTASDSDTPKASLISYSADTGNPVNFRNKVVITLKTDVVKVLQTIEVNNVSYGSSPISGVNNGYTLQNSNGDDIPGDLFTDNEDIIVELTYTDSSKGKAVSTLQRGLMVFVE